MGTTSTSPASFTGSSSFSAQLANVIAVAVGRASGPLDALQTEQSTITSQQAEMQTLSSNFQSLQTALDSVNSSAGFGSYSASVDNTSILSPTISSGVLPGTYSVNVSNTGSRTNAMSMNGLTTVSDPTTGNIDSSSTYKLTVNGTDYQLTDSAGSLNGLVQAINGSGAALQATVVNVGSSGSPDYRLSLQSLNYSPDSVQLSDGTNNLLSTLSTGSYVQYQVNGQPAPPAPPINSDSRTLSLSPGLSVNVLQTGTASVTVTQNTAGISNALNAFVSAYNNATDELNKNRGQSGGALAGDSVVYQLQNALGHLTNYVAPSGNIASLANAGVTFDTNGHLQFNQTTFNENAISDTLNFFGSETGGGFLQAASSVLTGVTDPTTGILPNATTSLTTELSSVGTQITNDQTQITNLQTSLVAQMAAADASISSMEQQLTEITDLFAAMQAQTSASNGH